MSAPAEDRGDLRPRPRRIQPRGEITQRRLLAAAIEILVEGGYARLSTTRVSERAGLSRGAQQHHFKQKSVLVAEAVRHLAEERTSQLSRLAERLPQGPERVGRAIDLLWGSFSDELFEAAVELWIAARTDPELRETLVPVEARVADSINVMARDLFGETWSAAEGSEDRVQLALNTIRGIALLRMLQHDGAAIDRQWRFARSALIELLAPVG